MGVDEGRGGSEEGRLGGVLAEGKGEVEYEGGREGSRVGAEEARVRQDDRKRTVRLLLSF